MVRIKKTHFVITALIGLVPLSAGAAAAGAQENLKKQREAIAAGAKAERASVAAAAAKETAKGGLTEAGKERAVRLGYVKITADSQKKRAAEGARKKAEAARKKAAAKPVEPATVEETEPGDAGPDLGADREPAPAGGEPHMLTLEEAKAVFGASFEPYVRCGKSEGEACNPAAATEVGFYGNVYRECLERDLFSFESSVTNPEIRGPGVVGFRIVDRDGRSGDECMRKHREAGGCSQNPQSGHHCISLTRIDSMRMTRPVSGSVKVAFNSVDPNADASNPNRMKWEPLLGGVTLISLADTEAARQAAAEREREKYLAGLRVFTNRPVSCLKSQEDIDEARAKADERSELGDIAEVDLKKLLKAIDKREMGLLSAKVSKASGEELADIAEQALSHGTASCDKSGEALKILRAVAVKQISVEEEDVSVNDGFDAASETLSRTSDELSECLSSKEQARLKANQRDLEMGRCSAIASEGTANGFLLAPCMANLMQGMQSDVMRAQKAVMKACKGRGIAGQACAQAQADLGQAATAYRAALQIPQQAQEAQAQIDNLQRSLMGPGFGAPQLPGGFAGGNPQLTPPQFNSPYGMPGSFSNFGPQVPQFPLPQQSSLMWAGGSYGLR